MLHIVRKKIEQKNPVLYSKGVKIIFVLFFIFWFFILRIQYHFVFLVGLFHYFSSHVTSILYPAMVQHLRDFFALKYVDSPTCCLCMYVCHFFMFYIFFQYHMLRKNSKHKSLCFYSGGHHQLFIVDLKYRIVNCPLYVSQYKVLLSFFVRLNFIQSVYYYVVS